MFHQTKTPLCWLSSGNCIAARRRLKLALYPAAAAAAAAAACIPHHTLILHSAGLVLVLTLFMAAASGLGAVPYFFVRSFSKEYSALASAVACGVMLAASFDLVHEGQPYGANLVILGVLSGRNLLEQAACHNCKNKSASKSRGISKKASLPNGSAKSKDANTAD